MFPLTGIIIDIIIGLLTFNYYKGRKSTDSQILENLQILAAQSVANYPERREEDMGFFGGSKKITYKPGRTQTDFHGLKVVDVREKLPRNENGGPSATRSIKSIAIIATHYDGVDVPNNYDPMRHLVETANYHINKDWDTSKVAVAYGDGIMYHFVIARDGTIYYTRDVSEVLWAVGDFNTRTLNIKLDGGPNQWPTREQAESYFKLQEEICYNHPEFPAGQANNRAHGELTATSCPGNFKALMVSYRDNRKIQFEKYESFGNVLKPSVPTSPAQPVSVPVQTVPVVAAPSVPAPQGRTHVVDAPGANGVIIRRRNDNGSIDMNYRVGSLKNGTQVTVTKEENIGGTTWYFVGDGWSIARAFRKI